jgi:hypothetical protein
MGFGVVERAAAEAAALRRLQNDLGNTPSRAASHSFDVPSVSMEVPRLDRRLGGFSLNTLTERGCPTRSCPDCQMSARNSMGFGVVGCAAAETPINSDELRLIASRSRGGRELVASRQPPSAVSKMIWATRPPAVPRTRLMSQVWRYGKWLDNQ